MTTTKETREAMLQHTFHMHGLPSDMDSDSLVRVLQAAVALCCLVYTHNPMAKQRTCTKSRKRLRTACLPQAPRLVEAAVVDEERS